LLEVLLYSIVSIVAFAAGHKWSEFKFTAMEWRTLKWSPDCMGYRIAQNGTKILRGEKAFLCLPISTDHLEPGQALLIFHEDD
jgi:hypothetical protein